MTGQFKKMVLVVLDGLRPDAITREAMPNLHGIARSGWQAADALTVRPSVTVAALSSRATGVSPAVHGFTSPASAPVGRITSLRPLPLELRRLGVETTVLIPQLGGAARWLAAALLRLGGVGRLVTAEPSPAQLMDAAVHQLAGSPNRELMVLYLNDADVAGHAWGWMSAPYLQAVAALDRALGQLVPFAQEPDTLLIPTADHGGGGVLAQDHDHPPPVNDRIPLILAGGRVMPGLVTDEPVRLLDIPPTVLNCFGGSAPAAYEGRAIHEAFMTELVWA
ncbi:MAG: alkaline phosphatase family protein [Gemmatimonadales bacterium]